MQLEPNGMLEDVTMDLSDERLKIKGNIPSGKITITKDGKVSLTTHNEKWCAIKEADNETVTMVEYKDGKCQSEESSDKSNVMYYGNMKTDLYEVSLTGGITKYHGNKEDLVVPSSFNISGSTYSVLSSDICMGEGNTKLTDGECQKAKQQALFDAHFYHELGVNVLDDELHSGYMIFEDIKFDYDACVEKYYNTFNVSGISGVKLEEPVEKFCTLDYLSRNELYALYELGIIEANVKTVDIPVVESFNYELNEQSCINYMQLNDPTMSNDEALFSCYVSMSQAPESLLAAGVATEKSGYNKFNNFVFDVQACSDKLYALGKEEDEVNSACHHFTLTNFEAPISIEYFYKTGIVTANKTTTYLQEGEVIEEYLFELDKDKTIAAFKNKYLDLEDEQVWIMAVAEAYTVVSEGGLEEILKFAESKTGNIIFRNIELQEARCKQVFTTLETPEEEIATSCNLQSFYENQIPIKAMYDLGVITADLEYLNMNAAGKKLKLDLLVIMLLKVQQ